MKKIILLLVISLFIYSDMNAEWIPISKDKSAVSATTPKVTIISDDENSTVIKVDISGFNLNESDFNGKTYHSANLLTEMFTGKPGYPELPYIAKTIAIPDNAKISFEILEIGEVRTFENIIIKPAQKSWFEGKEISVTEENIEAYQSDNIYPSNFAELESPSIFRDFRITRLSFFPLRYVASENKLELVSSITLKINYEEGEAVNAKTSQIRAIPPSFGKLYRSFIFNYQEVLDRNYNGKEEGHDLMLCIMPDEFEENFQPYADWKRQSGIDIRITKFSDIGANASNPITIKDHITDAYYDWPVPPTYVLIIGDDGIFPKKIVYYDYSFPNENFFVEIEGDDYFPEMMIGRFTNQGDYRMRVMINKFTLYETEPYTDDPEWFRKGICCSNNLYESQVDTKRFAANRMMIEGNFISVDTLMSDGNPYYGIPCSMNTSDVINALNDGRSFLNYRGEGWSSGWHASCTPFYTGDVSSLNNGEKFTFVTSIGCGVAMFDASGGNCFGEEWVQLGTLENPRGGIGFIGPTSNTHTTYNNKIDKGIYVGMFRESMDTPGQALFRGRLYMYNVFGNTYDVEYHYRVYCVLGDPSIHIWKDTPLEVDVIHETTVPNTHNELETSVLVRFESIDLPVDSAQVTIIGEDFFSSGYTNEEGIANLFIIPGDNDDLTITVRGGNVIPYQGTIDVVVAGIEHNENAGSNLSQNIPNPFKNETEINYSLTKSGNVSLEIYDIKGELVRTLQNGHQSTGNYSVKWNGLNESGTQAASGIYYYSLINGSAIETKKMILLK